MTLGPLVRSLSMLSIQQLSLSYAPAAALTTPRTARVMPQMANTADELETLAKELNPVVGYWDPLGIGKIAKSLPGDEQATIGWWRHAEIKHGRVAMAAFVGFLVNYQGITFPADLTMSGEKFSSLGTGNPLLAWDNISDKGKWSILGFIGLLEVLGEAEKPHYMRGGKSGTHDLVWYFGSKYLSGKTEEQKLRSRTAEINNGRLAMIGIMGFIAASTVPGSVPYFTEDLTQYSGSVWAPF